MFDLQELLVLVKVVHNAQELQLIELIEGWDFGSKDGSELFDSFSERDLVLVLLEALRHCVKDRVVRLDIAISISRRTVL